MPNFFDIPLARDRWTGGNVDDIDGRTPDGGGDAALAVGTWDKHPATNPAFALIGIFGGKALQYNGMPALYRLGGIPSLPTAYKTEKIVRFPQRDTFSPGSPGSLCTYYGTTIQIDENIPTQVSRQVPGGGGPSHTTAAVFWKWTGGAGSVEIMTQLSDGTYLGCRTEVGSDGRVRDYATYTDNTGTDHIDEEIGAGLPPVFLANPPNYCHQTGVDAVSSQISKFGPAAEQSTFRPAAVSIVNIISWSASGSCVPYNRGPDIPGGIEGAFEYAFDEVHVRLHPTARTSYSFIVEFDHSTPDDDPVLNLYLFETTAGVSTRLRPVASGVVLPNGAALLHDEQLLFSLEVTTDHKLTARLAGAVRFEFDLLNDLADETGALAALHATGDPGIGGYDGSDAGLNMEILEASVWGLAPCEGDDDNPFPTGPPPTVPVQGYLWPRRNTVWHPVPVPSDVDDQVQARRGGIPLIGRAGWVRKHTLWLPLEPGFDEDPPPNHPLPPYLDPCELRDPGEFPPSEPADPLVGVFFGLGSMPVTLIGDVFNLAGRALGSWTPGELAQAQVRGGAVLLSIGGYSKFIIGGAYSPAAMDAWIESWAPFSALFQAAQAAGYLMGVRIIDDFESRTLWPPDGIDYIEISRIAAKWRSVFRWGIRLGIRGRLEQFSGSAYPTGIDFYNAQYKYTLMGGNPGAWADLSLSLAAARNVSILWALNYINGGPNGRGDPCTPAEIVTAAAAFASRDKQMGMNGYQFDAGYLALPGVMDATTTAHNLFAA